LQSKFLLKNPNVCLSVCLCPLQQNKGGGERKKNKNKKILTNKMSDLCPLLHTKEKNLSLQQGAKKKKSQNQTMGVGFFSL
jgi:hypothetical protein